MICFNIGNDGRKWVEIECKRCGVDFDIEPEECPEPDEEWRCPSCGCAETVPPHDYRALSDGEVHDLSRYRGGV